MTNEHGFRNTPIDAALLGKIELARFLELPLGGFDGFVAESNPLPDFPHWCNPVG
jgi:hypothetical protein